jgi:hypothetical protein
MMVTTFRPTNSSRAYPKLLFRPEIQQDNLAVPVHHDHRIGSRFQQPAALGLSFRQVLFRVLARVDAPDAAARFDCRCA